MGAIIVDLTEAEFDDWDVEIVVHNLGLGAGRDTARGDAPGSSERSR